MFWLLALAFILWAIVSAYGWGALGLALLFAFVVVLATVDTFGDHAEDPRERRS